MSQGKEEDAGTTGKLQFVWGEKRGCTKDKSVRFYASFTYDGVEYFLYDCVYLYTPEAPEPFIGKIIKIWEQPGPKRKVKILWFFRPIEIRNFLGGCEKPLKNEIFLASGEGVGLLDVNPLESIGGKCNVICTSKDMRNPQPSDEELKMADYIFYRTFDVGSRTISDKIGDHVAGIEDKYIFNWKEALNNSVGDGKSGKNSMSKKTSQPVSPVQEAGWIADEKLLGEKATPKHEPSLDKNARKAGPPGASNDIPSKKIKISDSPKSDEYLQKSGSSVWKQGVSSDGLDKKASADVFRVSGDKTKSKHGADSMGNGKGSAGKSKLDATTNSSLKTASLALSVKEKQITNEPVVVPRRPESDTSKWFVGLPWDDRIRKAEEQETLVLLENFDIAYTSEEIEDLIYHFFKKKCSARMIEWSTFSNPYHGRALIICKNKGDADELIRELRARVLMLSNRRPLVARRAYPRTPGKPSKFFGHYFIDKLKHQMQREEWRKAVATSHCSQPNTIEYEMGLDWMLLQEKSKSWWSELYKAQEEEMRQTARAPKN